VGLGDEGIGQVLDIVLARFGRFCELAAIPRGVGTDLVERLDDLVQRRVFIVR
jgi:hypothetical protein